MTHYATSNVINFVSCVLGTSRLRMTVLLTHRSHLELVYDGWMHVFELQSVG